ncbi:capsid [uncultured virus]|uniref:Capsid n=1 Tax=uncultured virus TaxID=340016 RepID=A0A2K9LUI6_9VIRU|nr:capsid [uncultured virus]
MNIHGRHARSTLIDCADELRPHTHYPVRGSLRWIEPKRNTSSVRSVLLAGRSQHSLVPVQAHPERTSIRSINVLLLVVKSRIKHQPLPLVQRCARRRIILVVLDSEYNRTSITTTKITFRSTIDRDLERRAEYLVRCILGSPSVVQVRLRGRACLIRCENRSAPISAQENTSNRVGCLGLDPAVIPKGDQLFGGKRHHAYGLGISALSALRSTVGLPVERVGRARARSAAASSAIRAALVARPADARTAATPSIRTTTTPIIYHSNSVFFLQLFTSDDLRSPQVPSHHKSLPGFAHVAHDREHAS